MELSFPENEVPVDQEMVENHVEPSIGVTLQHSDVENYVNMGLPNGLHGERPFEYEPETEIELSEVEPSDINPLDLKPSVVELSVVEPSVTEPLEVVFEGPSEQTDPELDGPALDMEECPLSLFHIYAKSSKGTDAKELQPLTEGSDVTALEAGPDSNTQGEDTKPSKAPVRSKHLRFHCSHCQKLFKGGNVVRHTLAHLKLRKTRLSCVFCGKHFQRYNRAKEHVLEHVEELRTTTLNSKIKPAVNGNAEPSENVIQASGNETKPAENVTETPALTDQPPKPKRVKAKPVVSKQSRIIQNLRNLIRKTQKWKTDTDNQVSVEVKDEQVTVKDKVVIVKEVVPGEETEGVEKNECEGGEQEGKQKQYHLCPAEGCDSIFMKIGPSMLRHAVNYHMEDAAVLEKTFQWGKGKCQICQRHLLVFEHYRDHMKLHDAPLKQACLHMSCGQCFKTSQELKDHMDTHRPLQAPCGYSGCREIFFTLPSLHGHEWRHYTQPQSKDELEQGATKELSPEGEASWKQKVKSQNVTVHGWRETPIPKSKRADPHVKCIYCNRYLWNYQHFLDHMKIHDDPLKQVCLHQNCGRRFSRTHLLWEHMETHRPLQALCGYSGCRLIFSRLPSLHDHEWRHYTQGQPKDEPTEEQSTTKERQTLESDTNCNNNDGPVETPGTGAVTRPPSDCTHKLINGHDGEDKKDQAPETDVPATTTTSPTTPSQTTTPTHPHPSLFQTLTEPMTMRDVNNIVTLAQVMPCGEEPVIVEHKTFKPEDPSYLPLAKAPLIRPPPSTYLTEAALSMRKRRKPNEVTSCGAGKKSKATVKRRVVGKKNALQKEVAAEKEVEDEAPPQRQRCSKCFSSFPSPEELKRHLSQNTCSSLFNFDSDDDS